MLFVAVNVCYRPCMGKIAHLDMLWGKMPVLLALSRLGTLEAAAGHLNVNRTTVSRRLKMLEESVGGVLFDRTDGRYSLTPLGREILVTAEAAELHLSKMEALLPATENTARGPVKLTIAPHLAPLVAPVLVKIADRNPDIKLDVTSTYEVQQLEAREADIALRVLRVEPRHPLVGRRLNKLAGAIYAARQPVIDQPVYIVRHGEVAVPDAFNTWDDSTPVVTTDDIMAKQELQAAGGFGRLPVFMGDADPRLRRVSGLLPDAGWGLWLLTHEAFRSSPRLRVVIDAITAYFQKNPVT